MRKILTYLFVCFYFLLSTGVSANIHFCKKGFKSLSFNSLTKKSCCKAKGKTCKYCKDYKLVLKKSGHEKLSNEENIQLSAPEIILAHEVAIFNFNSPFIPKSIERKIHYFPPPGTSHPPLNIQYCNFRI